MFRRHQDQTDDNVDVLGALWPYLSPTVREEILAAHAAMVEGGAKVRALPEMPCEPPVVARRPAVSLRRLA